MRRTAEQYHKLLVPYKDNVKIEIYNFGFVIALYEIRIFNAEFYWLRAANKQHIWITKQVIKCARELF